VNDVIEVQQDAEIQYWKRIKLLFLYFSRNLFLTVSHLNYNRSYSSVELFSLARSFQAPAISDLILGRETNLLIHTKDEMKVQLYVLLSLRC
jgi:hypothetical protein